MVNMTDLLQNAIKENKFKGKQLEILEKVLNSVPPEYYRNFEEVLKSITKIYEIISSIADKKSSKERLNALIPSEAEESRSWHSGKFANLLAMIADESISLETLTFFTDHHANLRNCVTYLPESFRKSLLVVGTIDLLFRVSKIRGGHADDLGMLVYKWAERLGKFEHDSLVKELIKKHPFLQPVIFYTDLPIGKREIYEQRFGYHIGVKGGKNPMIDMVFEKQPLQDIYALCPFPTWSADKEGEEFWFQDVGWEYQKKAVEILNGKFVKYSEIIEIRMATIPEIMQMDMSRRLMVGDSSIDIGGIKCPHPTVKSRCILHEYGDYGCHVKEDDKPNFAHYKVIPLFVFKKIN